MLDLNLKQRPIRQELLGLPLHVFIAMPGGVAFAFLLNFLIFRPVRIWLGTYPGHIPLGIYSPVLWGPSILLGFVINRFTNHRSAYWVGMIGLLYLVSILMWDTVSLMHLEFTRTVSHGHFWQYEINQLFALDQSKCSDSGCIEELIATAPTFTSIAYSLGAWTALQPWARNTHE